MTIDENALKKDVAEIFAKDIDISVATEKDLMKKLDHMKKLGLANTQNYKLLVQIKTEQSYFIAYLYRVFEFLVIKNPSLLPKLSADDFRIRGMINVWKKSDIKDVRKMRKDIGNGGVTLMKNSIENSINKVKQYIEALEKRIKGI